MKNIPIPPKQRYLKSRMEKVESLITRLKWKAHFDKKKHSVNHKNFGFKSNSAPPQHELLSPFESDLCFKPVRNDFQKKLTEDINNIKLFENLLILADKTTKLYEMTLEQYKNILTNNVTKTYRKADRSTQLKIDREVKTISKSLQLEKRMERYVERTAFISLKDQEVNFKHNTECRLINPSKGEMGVVSKKLLEEMKH